MSILRNKKFTIIVIAIMAFIFFQSALPAVFIVRKGAHFTEYMILGGFLVPAVKEWMAVDTTPVPVVRERITAWLAGTLYAVTDEIHQSFVPGRSCELRDMGIDSCGVLAGVLAVSLVIWLKERKPSAETK